MDILISGSSTGLGRACAVHMARLGHNVWAGVRSEKAFEEVKKLNVKGLTPVYLDVCDEKSILECTSMIKKKAGILHGLVNNAGIAVGGPIEGIKLEDWRRQFETNVFGQIRVTQECLPLLRESKGRIVNMSSISGKIASPFLGPYAASKYALEAVSDSLRRELRKHGVKVSIVEPGAIATPIWEKSRTDGLEPGRFSQEIMDVYGFALQKFIKKVEKVEREASPVSVVTKAVEHALTAKNPRTRYPVGKGISFVAALSRALPDKLLDRVIAGPA
jgi:NAD(P)-dependent dehydrogenase (short-subunit alcohol dehydrogenase family)